MADSESVEERDRQRAARTARQWGWGRRVLEVIAVLALVSAFYPW